MQSTRVKLVPHVLRLALPLGLILLAAVLFFGTHSLEAFNKSPFPLPPTPRFNAHTTLPTEATARLVYDNQGRRHEAYRWDESGTYYDGEGRPLRKMFLRSPLRYSRITSLFSQHRFHPVLKAYRPHYGVDYGAPVGTPVEVTANGEVLFAGWDRGGGNVVKVRHAGGYVTAYLHLSRFAAGIRPGARVRQGEVIAYTGATGLASGPHLDYRVKHDDEWIDPLTLKSVRDEPIPTYKLAAFRSWRNGLLAGFATGVAPDLPGFGRAARHAVATLATPADTSLRPGAVAR